MVVVASSEQRIKQTHCRLRDEPSNQQCCLEPLGDGAACRHAANMEPLLDKAACTWAGQQARKQMTLVASAINTVAGL
jgi:hypothetical protein